MREVILQCNFSSQGVHNWSHVCILCCGFGISNMDSVLVNREDTGSPRFWASICLNNMAKLAREATTIRRVLEALFRYFDQGNLWSPDEGLALAVLMDMQSIMENSGLQLFKFLHVYE